MTLSNWITCMRLLVLPVTLWLLASHWQDWPWLIAGLFVFIGLSDMLDGYLARRRREVTELGKVLDPIADKLVQVSFLFMLAWLRHLPWELGVILLIKELGLVLGGIWVWKTKQETVAARPLGKAASLLLYVGVTGVILNMGWARVLVAVGVGLSLIAGVDYLRRQLVSHPPNASV